jgi:hypothetical protein
VMLYRYHIQEPCHPFSLCCFLHVGQPLGLLGRS